MYPLFPLLFVLAAFCMSSASPVTFALLGDGAGPPREWVESHVVSWPKPETNCSSDCVGAASCTARFGADVVMKGKCEGIGAGCTVPCGTTIHWKNTYQCVETGFGCPAGLKRCVWNSIAWTPSSVEECCAPVPPAD